MSQKTIQNDNHSVFWEHFASTTEGILELFQDDRMDIDDLRITDPSRIRANNALSVSIFLFKISENPAIKNHSISVFSEPEKQYSFSENILHYMLTVHSNEHMLGMNAIEKMLGIVYENPIISISNEIEKAHIRANFMDNPIDVWDKLFPSTPYRLSILLEVHGAGVTYRSPKAKPRIDIVNYDSTKDPELL